MDTSMLPALMVGMPSKLTSYETMANDEITGEEEKKFETTPKATIDPADVTVASLAIAVGVKMLIDG